MINLAKKTATLSVIAAAIFLVSACNEKSAEAAPATQTTATTSKITKDSPFQEKVAYSIGASVGTYIYQMQQTQSDLVGKLDNDLIIAGFMDALANKTGLESADIEATLRELDKNVQTALEEKMKKEAADNLAAGKKFLEENAKKEGVVTTASGLQYKVITEGSGKSPKEGDTISVKYKGTTIDGNTFDQQTEAVDFPLANMIPGWVEGVQLMKSGAHYEFYIPANLGYGEAGAGEVIKPNSVLVFDVELVDVKAPEAK